jgi:acyl-CoA dehydrogenase
MNGSLSAAAAAVCRIAGESADSVDSLNGAPEQSLAAFRRERLLGLLVPKSLGGDGLSLSQLASTCYALAQSCGSSAMIFAMHHIQVACIVAHSRRSEWHLTLLRRLCAQQLLLGSVTSEAGTGGNIHASLCAVEPDGTQVRLTKNATTISYGAQSDVLLITARRSANAAASDQVMLVAMRGDYQLERTSAWDALGMRGTCSDGLLLYLTADPEQILPVPFSEIASRTMQPVSHLLWSAVWLGIATDALARARAYLRHQGRAGTTASSSAYRLARATSLLQLMQSRLSIALRDYEATFADETNALPLRLSADMNTLKTSVSELCIEVAQHALMVCGIHGYRNGSPFSLGRHIRDLLSAPIMINNDRILESTSSLLLMQKTVSGVF